MGYDIFNGRSVLKQTFYRKINCHVMILHGDSNSFVKDNTVDVVIVRNQNKIFNRRVVSILDGYKLFEIICFAVEIK